jgi:ABC-2 type transport system permease protein
MGVAAVATGRRVALQLRHDPRTVVLLLVVPSLLLVLLRYVFNSASEFAAVCPALLGVFPLTLMFLVTSITTLRERTSGTLERLLTTPMAKLDLLVGYAIAFGVVALVQVVVAVGVGVALGLDVGGSIGWLLLVAAAAALLGVALGLLSSAFARTEFQAVQFLPVVIFPQLLLCGLFQPRDEMAPVLEWVSYLMPLSYAVEALQRVVLDGGVGTTYLTDLLVVVGCAVVGLALAAATLRRQTP